LAKEPETEYHLKRTIDYFPQWKIRDFFYN